MSCDEVRELAGAYALGALSPDEAREIEAHAESCALHEDLRALVQAAAALPLAAPEREPPPALRERVVAAVTSAPARVPVPEERSRAAREESPPIVAPRRLAVGRWIPYAAAAAFAALAIALGAWGLTNGGDLDATEHVIVASGGERLRLVHLPQEGVAIVTVEGLAPAPTGHSYQLWVIHDGAPRPAGLLSPVPGEPEPLLLEGPFAPGDAVAITIEPVGGSALPTTEPLLLLQS